ncbi:MAG: hypothetical protein ACRDK3_18020 [Actinomycetota bacterium]
MAVAVLGLSLAFYVLAQRQPGEETISTLDPGDSQFPSAVDNDPTSYDYPDDWTSTLGEARALAPFPILLPEHPDANPDNLQKVFVRTAADPGGTSVFLMFPVPEVPKGWVRQAYIELDIYRFKGEGDPSAYYQSTVEELQKAGYTDSYSEIHGHPVITKHAHVPTDVDQANPAYLSTVVGDIELQIVGGENLDRLVAIAEDLILEYQAHLSP